MPAFRAINAMQFLLVALPVSIGVAICNPSRVYADDAFTLSTRIEHGRAVLDMTSLQRREHAVAMARENRVQASARVLRAMYRPGESDPKVLHDLISVLSWQESYEEVLQLADDIDQTTAPGYALEAVARSARGARKFADAEAWYRLAHVREPDRNETRAGLAMSIADSGRHSDAREIYVQLPMLYRDSTDGALIDAYLWQSAGDPLQAILVYDRILDREPTHRSALAGKLDALQKLLLPEQALALAAQHPGLADPQKIADLETDRAALWVRWGETNQAPVADRFADIDRALEYLDANLARFPKGSPQALATRFDRILALRDRARYQAAVDAYRDLTIADSELPQYVQRAVASCFLALRQPAEALRLYDHAWLESPNDFALGMDRFYALVELEKHQQSVDLADQLVEAQPIWHTVPGSRVIKPNSKRLKAEIISALARAYADQLAASESMLGDMLREGPHNTDVRQELANVYRWRGWPERALFEYQQVLAVEPELLSARIGYANALLDVNRHELLEMELTELAEHYPENSGVSRLQRRNELYHRNEIIINAGTGESSGEQFGSKQHEINAAFYLKPFNHRWRPFLHVHEAYAEFSDGNIRRRRAGPGLEYRRLQHTATAGITASLEDQTRSGVFLSYRWQASDHWQFSGLLESETHALPLRGYREGVNADRLQIAGRYRISELTDAGLSGDFMDFSDGNFRHAWLLDANHRILNLPAWKVRLTGSIYTSSNDLTAVSYFSPSSDRSINIGLDSNWRLYRHYERSFSHRLQFNAGHYRQSGFPGGFTGSMAYQQVFAFSDALELFYGVRRNRALYDGQFEYGTFYEGGLRGRF